MSNKIKPSLKTKILLPLVLTLSTVGITNKAIAQSCSLSTDPNLPSIIFQDNFESRSYQTGNWLLSGNGEVASADQYDGDYSARVKRGGSLTKTISTVGYNQLHLEYARTTKNLSGDERLNVEWSTDNKIWYLLETTQSQNWQVKQFSLPEAALNQNNFSFRFNVISNRNTEKTFIDGVTVTASAQAIIPAMIQLDDDENMHMMTPEKMAEHNSAMALVAYDKVSNYSISSGNWQDPCVWSNGLPTDGDRVLISANHQINVDGIINNNLISVRVDGTLTFATDNQSELSVDTLLVHSQGRLEMGTVQNPVTASNTATLIINDYLQQGINSTDENSLDYDPYKLGQGLIAHGSVAIHGSTKTNFAVFSGAAAGEQTLTLDTLPQNWQVGDELIIAGTNSDASGAEEVVISALNRNTAEITLNQALQHDHLPPAHNKSGLDLKVHVANVSRNVVIKTPEQNRNTTAFNGQEYIGRGHVMFMHNNDVDVRYAGFYHLGRTNKLADMNVGGVNVANPIARYPLHFHRAGSAEKLAAVHGNVVISSPGFGYVNHSSAVAMTNNVAFNINGAAFVAEAGDEVGSFIGNLAIQTHGNGSQNASSTNTSGGLANALRFGSAGDGYWFESLTLDVRDNIAAGFTGSGFHYWPEQIDLVTSDSTVPKQFSAEPELITGEQASIFDSIRFKNNTAYGGAYGLQFGRLLDGKSTEFNLVDSFLTYAVNYGINRKYSHAVYVRDLVAIGANNSGKGVTGNNNSSSFDLHNAHIEGFKWGVTFSERQQHTGVFGGYFDNNFNIQININAERPQNVTIAGNVQFAPGAIANFYGYDLTPGQIDSNSVFVVELDSMDGPYQLYLPGHAPASTKNMAGFSNLELAKLASNPIEPPLIRADNIANIEVSATTSAQTIDLAGVFLDGLHREISYRIVSNSHPELVATEIIDDQLKLSFFGASAGESIIQIEAKNSANDKRKDAFKVTLKP